MGSIASSGVHIQTSPQSIPSTPSWLGEITLIVHHLHRQGALAAIEGQVLFARRRFGRYEVIDFLAVLFGYAVSSERTLEAFYERLQPWAGAFMALFGRDRLPARSTLSRFLAALDQAAVEALRTVFLHDLLTRPLVKEEQPGGLWDRLGKHFFVFDIDGTREAARQRALPMTADRPAPVRRLRPLCAPGYTGRKRGEVVRSRTTILQAHTYQWLATLGNAGNGEYRVELRRAVAIIGCYLKAHQHPKERALVRLDGQYGNGVVLSDLAGLPCVMRGKDYHLLKQPEVQTRLHLPPDQHLTHPESGILRALYDCPCLALGPKQEPCRVVVATHPEPTDGKSRVGLTRDGVIYELFYTTLPQNAFTASDVVALYAAPAVPLKLRLLMKISNRILTVGVVIPQTVKKHGKSSANGSGTCAWNWATSFILTPYARPSLPLPPRLLSHTPLPPRAMLLPRWGCAGSQAASRARTLLCSQTGPCVALLVSRSVPMSDAGKGMEACAWSMPPASAVAVRVFCENNANGRAKQRRNRDRSVCSCILSTLGRLRCSGVIGAVGAIDERVSTCCALNGERCWQIRACLLSRTSCQHLSRVHSVHITGSTLLSGCFATPAPQPPAG